MTAAAGVLGGLFEILQQILDQRKSEVTNVTNRLTLMNGNQALPG
jgi:hypothetical protein